MAARDRLAAMRAQQQGGRYDTPTQQDSFSGGGGYQSRRPNPYAQQDDSGGYEMSSVRGAGGSNGNAGAGGGFNSFYDEVDDIQRDIDQYNRDVDRIRQLHSSLLNNTSNTRDNQERELEQMTERTSASSQAIKKRIQALGKKAKGRDVEQFKLVKSQFIKAIQNYQVMEKEHRDRTEDQFKRQYKIVKPDASNTEVEQAMSAGSGDQIFAQALLNSNRYGEARSAYKAVQDRHNEIKEIESTLAELAQLVNDMSILVEQQDETINQIEQTAATVEKDTEAGLGYTDKAVVSARGARKKRWICFFIILIILIILAIIIAVEIVPKIRNNNKS